MKNSFIKIIIACMMSFLLFGCSNNVSYKDGEYTAKGDKWQYGNEEAIVVIKENKIKEITLKRLDSNGTEVDYEKWTGKKIDNKVFPNLKQYRIDLANKIIEKQTNKVDSISGATVSCENWKLAVERALKEATK